MVFYIYSKLDEMNHWITCISFTFFIATASMPIYAQQFELKSNDESKTFDYNSEWYVVQNIGKDVDCCNSRRYLGNFIDISEDTIRLSVKEMESRSVDDEKSYYSKVKFNRNIEFPIYSVAKSDLKIMYEKESRWKDVFGVTGAALLLTGAGTLVHAFIVDDDDRRALLISSGIQLATSITLISISVTKNNKYKIEEGAWSF